MFINFGSNAEDASLNTENGDNTTKSRRQAGLGFFKQASFIVALLIIGYVSSGLYFFQLEEHLHNRNFRALNYVADELRSRINISSKIVAFNRQYITSNNSNPQAKLIEAVKNYTPFPGSVTDSKVRTGQYYFPVKISAGTSANEADVYLNVPFENLIEATLIENNFNKLIVAKKRSDSEQGGIDIIYSSSFDSDTSDDSPVYEHVFKLKSDHERLIDLDNTSLTPYQRDSYFSQFIPLVNSDSNKMASDIESSFVGTLSISGKEFIAFIQPETGSATIRSGTQIIKGNSDDSESGPAAEYLLIGLVEKTAYEAMRSTLPLNWTFLILLFFLAILFSIPLIRMSFISKEHCLTKPDLYSIICSFLLIIPIFYIVLLDYPISTKSFRDVYKEKAALINDEIKQEFFAEIDRKLLEIDTLRQLKNRIPKSDNNREELEQATDAIEQALDLHAFASIDNAIIFHVKKNDPDGSQSKQISLIREDEVIPKVEESINKGIKTRSYYQKTINGQYYTRDGHNFIVERIQSWLSAKKKTILISVSENSSTTRFILTGSQFSSLEHAVLPAGFKFLIWDARSGDVIYHSEDRRSFVENIYQETEQAVDLKSAIAGNTDAYLNIFYDGSEKGIYISPLNVNNWIIGVYFDKDIIQISNFRFVLTTAVAMIFILFGTLFALWVVKRSVTVSRLTWAFPNIILFRTYQYLILVISTLSLFIVLAIFKLNKDVFSGLTLPILVLPIMYLSYKIIRKQFNYKARNTQSFSKITKLSLTSSFQTLYEKDIPPVIKILGTISTLLIAASIISFIFAIFQNSDSKWLYNTLSTLEGLEILHELNSQDKLNQWSVLLPILMFTGMMMVFYTYRLICNNAASGTLKTYSLLLVILINFIAVLPTIALFKESLSHHTAIWRKYEQLNFVDNLLLKNHLRSSPSLSDMQIYGMQASTRINDKTPIEYCTPIEHKANAQFFAPQVCIEGDNACDIEQLRENHRQQAVLDGKVFAEFMPLPGCQPETNIEHTGLYAYMACRDMEKPCDADSLREQFLADGKLSADKIIGFTPIKDCKTLNQQENTQLYGLRACVGESEDCEIQMHDKGSFNQRFIGFSPISWCTTENYTVYTSTDEKQDCETDDEPCLAIDIPDEFLSDTLSSSNVIGFFTDRFPDISTASSLLNHKYESSAYSGAMEWRLSRSHNSPLYFIGKHPALDTSLTIVSPAPYFNKNGSLLAFFIFNLLLVISIFVLYPIITRIVKSLTTINLKLESDYTRLGTETDENHAHLITYPEILGLIEAGDESAGDTRNIEHTLILCATAQVIKKQVRAANESLVGFDIQMRSLHDSHHTNNIYDDFLAFTNDGRDPAKPVESVDEDNRPVIISGFKADNSIKVLNICKEDGTPVKDIICIFDFERIFSDTQYRLSLEELCKYSTHREKNMPMVIFSEISPLYWLSNLGRLMETEKSLDSQFSEASKQRWLKILADFTTLTYIPPDECNHSYLYKDIAELNENYFNSKDTLRNNKAMENTEKALREQYPQYVYTWEHSTDDERRVLSNLAEQQLINPAAYTPINSLFKRGLIIDDGRAKFADNGFRHFVLHVENRKTVLDYNKESLQGWKRIRLPLFSFMAVSFYFMIILGNPALSAISTLLIGASIGIIPVALLLLSNLQRYEKQVLGH